MAKKQRYYQRPDGLFETIRTINGKRVAFRGRSCREVDRKLLEFREVKEKGRLFPVIADAWEREHEKDVKDSSRLSYRSKVERLKAEFTGPASEITPLDVQRYIRSFEKKGYAAETTSTELSILRSILSFAVIAGDIDINPAAEINISKGLPRRTREALTEEQEAVVRTQWKELDFGLFPLFLLYTGMRRGEALAISFSDIDRKRGVIHVTKKLSYAGRNRPVLENWTKSQNGIRDIPLLAPLAEALPKNRIGLVFPGKDGGYMTQSELYTRWKGFCREAGFTEELCDGTIEYPISPHCFRHSFATICYEAGLDARQAAPICGDTPKVLEKTYTHLREKRKATAADILEEYVKQAK